ncbi:uncharacterized protein LOC144622971 isoform X2 [Crassostrea virginica]
MKDGLLNSDVTRREDCMEASEEEEVSGREEFMARVPYGTPGMDSSLPTSPTAAVGEGVFTGEDGATEETLEEVSSREEIIPGVSNETPGMDSSLPTSPTAAVGEGVFTGDDGATEETLEEVSSREEIIPGVSNETPGMDSSLPTSPTAAVGEGVFTGDDGATEETLEEVSSREEIIPGVSNETPGMDSSLPTSPTAAVGEGVFTGDDGATEETLEEVSSREEIIPGVSNETPGMDSSLPTSPTVDVGKGFFSCTPESMEEEELETQDDLAMDTATDVDVQNLQKIGWDDVALTKYIHKIWSKQKSENVESFLLSKTCGVSIDNKSLTSAKSLITDEIIDAYLGIICGVLTAENRGKVLLAIVNRREIHWILLAIDQQYKTLLIIDPMGESRATCHLILELWINYLKKRGHDAKGWKTNTVHHSKQQDSISCGVYCMKFAEGVVLNTSLDVATQKDNVQEMRCNIMKTIINNQDEDTRNFCRRCFRQEPPKNKSKRINWVQCDGCAISWYHTDCLNLKQVKQHTFFMCDICKMSD